MASQLLRAEAGGAGGVRRRHLPWVDADGFLLRELPRGLTVDDARAATGAPLPVANDIGEVTFG